VRNVLVLHLAERPKQFPRSGAVATLTIYVSHDLLLDLNVTATDSDVSLGFIKGRRLHRRVHPIPYFAAALPIVQRTQAIEQILNARWWLRLFF
jgi:hypothetical protein